MNGRNWLHFDRFAWLQLGEQHRLGVNEIVVLLYFTSVADIRSHTWTGTITEVAAELRLPRRAVSKAIECLSISELLLEEEAFGGHRKGRVAVLVYDTLIRPPKGKEEDKPAPNANTIRAPREREQRESARVTSEIGEPLGMAGEGEVGMSTCSECGLPVDGHPFNGHEPSAGADPLVTLRQAVDRLAVAFPGAVVLEDELEEPW